MSWTGIEKNKLWAGFEKYFFTGSGAEPQPPPKAVNRKGMIDKRVKPEKSSWEQFMRKIIDLQMEFWKKDIVDIEFDLRSRDEIPKLMIGLQYIYGTPAIREKVFNVLKRMVPKKVMKAADRVWICGRSWF